MNNTAASVAAAEALINQAVAQGSVNPILSSGGGGTGSTGSWIANLTDPVIKADMTAASSGGVVSEAGMAKLFTDLAAELSSGNTTLSASQMNDLQTIATHLNVGERRRPM